MSISCNRYSFAVFLTRISKCEVNGYPEYFLSASRSGSPSRTHFHQLSLDFCKEMMTWKSWVKARVALRVALRVATLEPLQFKSCGLMLIFQVPNRLLDTTPRHSQVKAMGSTVWVCLCVCVSLCETARICRDVYRLCRHRQT